MMIRYLEKNHIKMWYVYILKLHLFMENSLRMTILKACLVFLAFDVMSSNSFKILYAQFTKYSWRVAKTYLQAVVPGTKWCGDGDIAEDYDDLGNYRETDMCCREHDHCSDIIVAGSSKHGLKNGGNFTRLTCKCDYKFYSCLKSCKDVPSSFVGFAYFNILGDKCYAFRNPATCLEYEEKWGNSRCIRYSYNNNLNKKWQWFDVRDFLGG